MTEAVARFEATLAPAVRRMRDALRPGYRSHAPSLSPSLAGAALAGSIGERSLGERVRTPQGELGIVRALFTPARHEHSLSRWALVLLDGGDHRDFDCRELTSEDVSRYPLHTPITR
jgi:hypothetical protein